MTAWTDALAEYQRATMIVDAIDSEKNEDAFDAAADVQGKAIEALIAVPAPDLAAVAVKLQVISLNGAQYLMAPISADVERFAKPPAAEPIWGERNDLGYALPRTFPGISPALADAAESYRTAYFSTGERAGADTAAAATGIAATKATSIPDLAAKVILGMLECEPINRDAQLIIDLGDFATDGGAAILLGAAEDAIAMIPPAENPKLVQAFEDYRQTHAELRVSIDDLSDEAAAPFYARMDPADMIMADTSAVTVAGAIMRLKRAFVGIVPDHWAADAILDKKPASFGQGLELADVYIQIMWGAIEDLERIATGGARG